VRVWAGVDPQSAVATWSGDADLLDAPDEWNAGLVMPTRDVSVTASTVAVDAPLEARTWTLAGRERTGLVHLVDDPVGVVLFFHGARFSVDQLRSNAAHTIAMQLARAGWSVVAVPSEQEAAHGVGAWDTTLDPEANTDLANVQILVGQLRD